MGATLPNKSRSGLQIWFVWIPAITGMTKGAILFLLTLRRTPSSCHSEPAAAAKNLPSNIEPACYSISGVTGYLDFGRSFATLRMTEALDGGDQADRFFR